MHNTRPGKAVLPLLVSLVFAISCARDREPTLDTSSLENQGEAWIRAGGLLLEVTVVAVPVGFEGDVAGPALWLGRFLSDPSTSPSASQEALLTSRLWEELGKTPEIIGKTVELDGDEFVVVGVLEDASVTDGSELWTRAAL